MSGYSIVIAITLIMFVGLMIYLLQGPEDDSRTAAESAARRSDREESTTGDSEPWPVPFDRPFAPPDEQTRLADRTDRQPQPAPSPDPPPHSGDGGSTDEETSEPLAGPTPDQPIPDTSGGRPSDASAPEGGASASV